MEARGPYSAVVCLIVFFSLICSESSDQLWGAPPKHAPYKTPNFIVHAPTPDFAKQVGVSAEQFRKELAVMWIGKELPNWSAPCPIFVKVGQIGAGGATTFSFHQGEVFGWRMNIQGSQERILDSVLPHEITHTILACRFRRPLPRWADEGVCTLVEHESERRRQTLLLGDVIKRGRRIPLRSLFSMTEYPSDMREVLKLYAQGYSLVDYLVQQGGRETFMQFLHDAHRHGSWDQALGTHYGVNSIDKLEKKWGSWVLAGSPVLNTSNENMLVDSGASKKSIEAKANSELVVRGQNPEQTGSSTSNSIGEKKSAMIGSPSRSKANEKDAIPFQPNARVASVGANHREIESANFSGDRAVSRGHLVQPVFIWSSSMQARRSEKVSRGHLQLTREGFSSPRTPVSGSQAVNPFVGNNKKDPFSP